MVQPKRGTVASSPPPKKNYLHNCLILWSPGRKKSGECNVWNNDEMPLFFILIFLERNVVLLNCTCMWENIHSNSLYSENPDVMRGLCLMLVMLTSEFFKWYGAWIWVLENPDVMRGLCLLFNFRMCLLNSVLDLFVLSLINAHLKLSNLVLKVLAVRLTQVYPRLFSLLVYLVTTVAW
jgi:hypothetical protein